MTKSSHKPWHPPSYVKADAAAIQALRNGTAEPDQQTRAIEYIVEKLCARDDMSYHPGPDGERDTVFAEGRRFVGNQIVKLANMPLSKIE